MYYKQKSDPTRDDWYDLLKKDFEFVGLTIDENEIRAMSKLQYKNKIKPLVKKAAFEYFLKEKRRHSKLNEVSYNEFKIQSYLKDSREERKLLTSMRSRCYNVRKKFQKIV